jgi:hypothetical protein
MAPPHERFTSLTEMADLVTLGKIECALFDQVRGTELLDTRIEDIREVLILQPRSTLDLSKCTSKNCMIRTLYDALVEQIERMERSAVEQTHDNNGISLANRIERLVMTIVNVDIHTIEENRFHHYPHLKQTLEELRLTPEHDDV